MFSGGKETVHSEQMGWLFFIINVWQSPKHDRSSNQRFSIRKLLIRFSNILRKTLVFESLFNEVAGLQACNFIKKKLQHRCFPVNIAKFLRIPILRNSWKQLFLTRLYGQKYKQLWGLKLNLKVASRVRVT